MLYVRLCRYCRYLSVDLFLVGMDIEIKESYFSVQKKMCQELFFFTLISL